MIHVSGVGLLGSFVLHDLECRGLRFTWDDVDAKCAWRASTGAVIPCEDRDGEHYARGYRFWRDSAANREELRPFLEQVETIYVMTNPPSRVTRRWRPEVCGVNRVWREDLPGWQFDVDRFVESTRAAFAGRRAPEQPGDWVLRSRGVAETVNRPTVVWGWRAAATVKPAPGSTLWSRSGLRPVVHFNDPDRAFERYYFHPRAGDPGTWWCGSEAVLQKVPTDAPERAARGFRRYTETVTTRFGDQLEVSYLYGLTQGWRAKPRAFHKGLLAVGEMCYETVPRTFVALPLYKSGVQCGPWYSELVVKAMLARGAS